MIWIDISKLLNQEYQKVPELNEFVKNVLNIDVNDVMAIGDSQNDISMFQIVGYPY
ncbi:HAD hydrolase family protein [Mycoplasmopsis cynos]|uniref:HAD hydrolase family protein n=1 Tax=Mycoplasmopsis cynos TaxID=171284 RepID=UPI001CB7944D|nr:HAD hydrolase family protein [Mycoplasmopsis cynos]